MPKVKPEYKDTIRGRIVQAALAEFSEKGYRGSRMEDISKRSGLSKGAVYQYFESKGELLQAILDSVLGQTFDAEMNAASNMDFSELTKSSMQRVPNQMPEGFHRLILEMLADAATDEDTRQVARAINDRVIANLSEMIETGMLREGKAIDVDPKDVARGLVALQHGMMAQLAMGVPKKKVEDAWIAMVRALPVMADPWRKKA